MAGNEVVNESRITDDGRLTTSQVREDPLEEVARR